QCREIRERRGQGSQGGGSQAEGQGHRTDRVGLHRQPDVLPLGHRLVRREWKPTDRWGLFAECEVPKDQREKVWLLARNQKVKVVGELQAVQKDRIRLIHCQVTELERNPMPTIRAVELAKAYAQNEREAGKQYCTRYN